MGATAQCVECGRTWRTPWAGAVVKVPLVNPNTSTERNAPAWALVKVAFAAGVAVGLVVAGAALGFVAGVVYGGRRGGAVVAKTLDKGERNGRNW